MREPSSIESPRRCQSGFSLLEVLVALGVLSIGLLGLAALQTISLRLNTDSYTHTQATVQAYDIIDRMRANPIGLANGNYNTVAAGALPGSTNCISSACSSTELAEYDIRTWNTLNSKLLNGGKGEISTSGNRRTVRISWTESDLNMSVSVVFEL